MRNEISKSLILLCVSSWILLSCSPLPVESSVPENDTLVPSDGRPFSYRIDSSLRDGLTAEQEAFAKVGGEPEVFNLRNTTANFRTGTSREVIDSFFKFIKGSGRQMFLGHEAYYLDFKFDDIEISKLEFESLCKLREMEGDWRFSSERSVKAWQQIMRANLHRGDYQLVGVGVDFLLEMKI